MAGDAIMDMVTYHILAMNIVELRRYRFPEGQKKKKIDIKSFKKQKKKKADTKSAQSFLIYLLKEVSNTKNYQLNHKIIHTVYSNNWWMNHKILIAILLNQEMSLIQNLMM